MNNPRDDEARQRMRASKAEDPSRTAHAVLALIRESDYLFIFGFVACGWAVDGEKKQGREDTIGKIPIVEF